MHLIRKNGATSNIFRVLLRSSSTGQGLLGLTGSSPGLIISTICDNEASATAYTQAATHIQTIAALGTYAAPSASNCRFSEVDSTNHPGLYEVQLADARFAVSSAKLMHVTFTGAASLLNKDVTIQLTSTDVDDAVRYGMTSLPNANAAASGGLWILGSNNTAAVTIGALTTGAIACTTITASGAVAFQSTFTVTTSTALGAISGSTLTLSGAVTFQSTFVVTASTALGALSCSTLTASGAVAFQSTFAVTNSTNLAALSVTTITASGTTSLAAVTTSGTVTLNALTVTNNALISGTLTVTGATTFTGAVTGTNASNDLRINGIVPGVANGLFIAGTNAATSITTGLTAHIIGTVDTATNLTNAPTAGDLTAAMKTSVTTAATAATPTINATQAFSNTGTWTGNIVGTLSTVTTLTNLPAVTADWLTAAGVKADAVTKIQSGLATPINITAASGIALAANQHVIVDSGTVTTLTNLPAITTDWLSAAGVSAAAVTKIQSGLATPTNISAGTITNVTNLTNAATVGDITTAMKTSIQAAADAAITSNVLILEIESEADGIAAIPTSNPSAVAIRSEIDSNSTQLAIIISNEATINANVLTRLPTTSYTIPPTLSQIASQVWSTSLTGTAFTTGEAGYVLESLGVSANPLLDPVPGSYAVGTAGYALGQIVDIEAKTNLIGAVAVTIQSPIDTTGTINILAGDSYKLSDGRQIDFTNTAGTWPDLTGSTISFVATRWTGGSPILTKACSPVTPTGSQLVRLELNSVDTVLDIGGYNYKLKAVLSDGNTVTLQTGVMHIA